MRHKVPHLPHPPSRVGGRPAGLTPAKEHLMRGESTAVGMVSRTDCPACGSRHFRRIYRRSFGDPWMRAYFEAAYFGHLEQQRLTGGTFALDECRQCGLIFQREILNEELTQLLYDVWIDPEQALQWRREAISQSQSHEWGCSILLGIESRLPPSDGRRPSLLDYGAGFGEISILAQGFGFAVAAFELSEERESALADKGITTVSSLDGLQRSQDAVVLASVLEHLPDPLACLQSVRAAMRPGGVLFVSVPDCRELHSRSARFDDLSSIAEFKSALAPCSPLQHINSFTGKSLKTLLVRAGFRITGAPRLKTGYPRDAKSLVKQTVGPAYQLVRQRYAPSTQLFAANGLG
jgi:SAM-dependent methyltransferase